MRTLGRKDRTGQDSTLLFQSEQLVAMRFCGTKEKRIEHMMDDDEASSSFKC